MEGVSLNIGTEVLKKLDEADKKLQQIAQHTEGVAKAMKTLTTDGLNNVVGSLSKMNTSLSKLAKNSSLANIGTQANQSVDAINRMVTALANLTNQQQIRLQTQQAKFDYKKEANDLKELTVAENERTRALDRQNKANIANNKSRQALETKKLANDTKELMNLEQERGRQLILQNQKNIASYQKQSVKLKQQINEINRLAAAYRQMPKSINQKDLNKVINSASKTKTINQYITAIHNLKNALNDLDRTSPKFKQNYEAINKQLQRNRQELAKLGINLDSVNRKKKGLMDTAGQLQRKLALVFSVSQIASYMNKLVNIRREMELQHRSLQVLLQDRHEADKLWQQTIDLAVRSPYRVKELVTYTKQLAAYRIETDKLHETTRRLADVSSGLGVDMQRLILAYGQVRAAEYLRGTELRQFTEAGIPMLDELSKYFSEIEDRAVSAGDVFARISKRMVSFGDVTEVFRRMTSEGGVFYKMQEKQAETLHGIISNLHDSIDLMLNDIGEANDGLLKNTVLAFRGFIENWRIFGEILTQIGSAAVFVYLRKKLLALLTLTPKIYAMAASLTAIGGASGILTAKLTALGGAIKALGKALTTGTMGWISLGVVLLSSIKTITAYKQAIDETNKKYNELSNREVDSMRKLREFNDAIIENNKKIKENNKILQDSKSKVEDKTKAENDNKKAIKENGEALNELSEKYPQFYKGIKQQKDGTIQLTNEIEKQNEILRINIALQQQAKGDFWNQDFSKNYTQALNEWRNVENALVSVQTSALSTAVKLSESFSNNGVTSEVYDDLNVILQKIGDAKTVEEVNELNKSISSLKQNLMFKVDQEEFYNVRDILDSLNSSMGELFLSQRDYNEVLKDWFNNINKQIPSYVLGAKKYIDEAKTKEIGQIDAGDWITKNLENLGVANEQLLSDAQKYIQQQLFEFEVPIEVSFKPKGTSKYTEADLAEEWRRTVWNAIKAVEKTNPEIRLGIQLDEMVTKGRNELANKIRESVENAIKENDRAIKALGDFVQIEFTQEQAQQAKKAEPLLDFLGNLVNFAEKTEGSGKDWLSETIKGVKEAHQEFLKLNKTLSETEARQLALEKYKDVFAEAAKNAGLSGVTLSQFKFQTEQGTIDALEFLRDKLPSTAKQARIKLEEALGEIKGEFRIQTKEENDQKLIQSIENMFSGYELSLELEKLNIPPDLAKQLFNVESLTLPELKDQIIAMKPQFVGKDMEKEYNDFLKKIDEMEEKAQMERLKKYTQYLIKGQGERVKIKMDEMRQLAEIEQLGFTESQKELARQAIQKDSKQKMDKLEWEDFKDSGMYVQLFEDLEYVSTSALKKMREKLSELKTQLKDLDADDLKHLYSQIEKLDKEISTRNPYKSAINGIDEYVNAIKNAKKLEEDLLSAESIETDLKNQEANVSKELALEQSKFKQIKSNLNASGDEVNKQYLKVKELETQLALLKAQLIAQGKLTDEIEEQLDANKQIRKSFTGDLSQIGSDISEAANILPQIASDLENVFGAMDAGTRDTIESISEIGSGVGDAIQGFASQNYIQAVGGVIKAIGGIFAIGDKKKERQIQREIEKVDELNIAYQKLEKAIDNAYSIDTLQASGEAAKANLEAQIDSYEKMIAAEEDKKKTDKDRIKEWEAQIDEIREQVEEMNKGLVSTATAGIMDSVLSASQEFTDAWLEAFNETGDGLSGLSDNFKSTMLEMVKQQAAMLISQSYVEKWKKQLEQYINPDDLELSTDEAKKWVDAVSSSLPQLNDALENYFTAMQQAGVDLGGEASGELSGLAKGISGITESQADILAAYANSCRFFLANIDTTLTSVANQILGGENMPNPILSELRTQTELVRGISTLLNSMTTSYPNGGRGWKVVL